MRAAVITTHGAPEVLQMRELPDPEPAAGEVRIRVEAAGVNFADIAARMGLYPGAPAPPCVVGYEVAGTVDALGPEVEGLEPGEAVLALTRFGGYGSLCCTDARAVRRRPEGMDALEGAALPVVSVTAHHMLHGMQRLHPEDRVLIHAAAGGVGIAAVQLCRHAGVEAIFGTASSSKHAFLRQLGVRHPIDYRNEDFAEAVLRLTGGEGVDVVLDALGGGALARSYRLLRPGGRLVTFGFSAAVGGKRRSLLRLLPQLLRMPRFRWRDLLRRNLAVIGVDMAGLNDRPELIARALDGVLQLWEEGALRPHVDRSFPVERASLAHHYIQDRKNVGKVVLVF